MSRVRENRMHGSMGGIWNRGVATATRTWAPGENAGAVRRGLPPFNVTAPAPYPTATDKSAVHHKRLDRCFTVSLQ